MEYSRLHLGVHFFIDQFNVLSFIIYMFEIVEDFSLIQTINKRKCPVVNELVS